MEILRSVPDADALAALFRDTFTASEGAAEGKLIGAIARDLLATTPPADLRLFAAVPNGSLAGAVLFTRLRFGDDPRVVWLLSPVAVLPTHQRQGIGAQLIRAGLDALRAEGASAAFTYGDPAFYGRLGFAPITAAEAPPPHPLSQPIGWLAQNLTEAPLTAFPAPSRCAPALDDAGVW